MANCPSCHKRLVKQGVRKGVVYVCPGCKGRWAAISVLRTAGAPDSLRRELWARAADKSAPRVRPCPHCARRMAQVKAPIDGQTLQLDVCTLCAGVWFDASEYEALPLPPPTKPEMSQKAREQIALLKVKTIQERADADGSPTMPDQAWHWLPGLMGLPVELGAAVLKRLPWVTWLVAAACVLATVPVALGDDGPGGILSDWGFIPAQWARHDGLTLVTSFFLHAGVLHVVGNMWFLLVFGDNVEDRFGRLRFALLLAISHVAGLLVHGLIDPRGDMPLVGASAGVSGVVAAYALTFPRVRLAILFRVWYHVRWLRLSALTAFILFVLLQLAGAWLQGAGLSSVSYLGHLGGLAVGVLVALVIRSERSHAARDGLSKTRDLERVERRDV